VVSAPLPEPPPVLTPPADPPWELMGIPESEPGLRALWLKYRTWRGGR
jgi:hypothetical protein